MKWRVIERKLGRERAVGQVTQGEGIIEVDPRQNPKEYMDTLIHEALHLLEPDWSEKKVCAYARKISRLLWSLGYRRLQE
jgi:hypothetical protein